MNIESIRHAFRKNTEPAAPFQEFAVLIPLYESEGSIHVLFEVRSKNLTSQPGEICLPGGRIEENESFEATALRETCEELGICPEKVELLGSAAPLITPFRYALHPFVGLLKDFSFLADIHMNADEVAEVFSVPLDWFMTHPPQEYAITTQFDFPEDFPYHLIQNGRQYAWKSTTYPVHFYTYGHYIIWGMTAKIISDFCQRLASKT